MQSETFYNAGWTSDMREVLYEIKARLPAAPLALVGTSLGANMVIKFLAEEGDDCPIWGAVAMGCPHDLLVCDRFMNRTYVQVRSTFAAFATSDIILFLEQKASGLDVLEGRGWKVPGIAVGSRAVGIVSS